MFVDRRDAGRQLAERLAGYARLQPIVIGLARGGVPVAAEVASRLNAPLDLIVVRKIGTPWQPELGIGAIAEGGVRILNDAMVAEVGMSPEAVAEATARELDVLSGRVLRYRGDRAPLPVDGRIVILVDDGLATGYTARAAIQAMRRRGASRIVLAVPVGARESLAELQLVADEVIALEIPDWLAAIGEFYEDFGQISDEDVLAILEAARLAPRPRTAARSPGIKLSARGPRASRC